MTNKNIIEVYADYIYYGIIGDKQKIEHYNTLEGFSYGQNDAWVATIILIVIFILILMAIKIVY